MRFDTAWKDYCNSLLNDGAAAILPLFYPSTEE
jgi:hypothetical protein